MKKSLYAALVPFLSVLFVLGAVALTVSSKGAVTAGAASPFAPTNWTVPLDVSNSPLYDNGPEVAASPLDGGATLAWEQRDVGSNPTFNLILQASNTSLGGPFGIGTLQRSGWKLNGAPQAKHDSLGRRHVIWYHNSGTTGSTVCGYYAVVGTNGQASTPEQIPGTCGRNRKMDALAIGPDNSVHILFGWIGYDMHYWQRSPNGAWVVQGELIPEALGARVYPESPAIAVSTNGVIMAAWKDLSPSGSGSDIFTAIRTAPNQWTVEDISYSCCTDCPTTSGAYTPSLTPDRTGGFRLAWGDERCPRTGVRGIDLYHRTWVPGTGNGWNNQPIVRVFRSSGEAYDMGVAVDESNVSHIVWSDDTGRPYKNTTIYYASGTGTSFTAPTAPFAGWSGDAYSKEPSIDYAFGNLHAAFSSIRHESNKDNYYVRMSLGPPTPIATATPRCAGQRFSDVCPGDTFYTYIMNLVNLNVISGYSDGTFRPANLLTRGQAAKILALAANLPSNLQGAPHFSDVPSTHTFYQYIEFSFNAGIIGGYTCGGPGEPCDAQRRGYFRPDNDITRGQLSKMTALAFGFNEPVSGQTFTDVPPNSTFYAYIERMARRGIIGGYTDGTFRPSVQVTRGQASKIVDGARLQVVGTPLVTNTATFTATSTLTVMPTGTLMPTITIAPTLEPTFTVIPTFTATVESPTATSTLAAGGIK